MESVRISMESIKNIDSIGVFIDSTDPLGSIELDRQSRSQFYASPFYCTVRYRTVPYRTSVRYLKWAGKDGIKIKNISVKVPLP